MKPAYIPHSRPTVGDPELQKLSEVIHSGHISQGQRVSEFEQYLSQKVGTQDGAACSSGTAALHLTLAAMGVGPGDEVIFPSYVCSALLHSVRHVGATPVLADIDPVTHNIDPGDAKNRLTERTKAIIVPHLFGLSAHMGELLQLGIPLIEDCAQALGASYEKKSVGGLGHASIFSFYATKMIATGEGGMVLSNNPELVDRVRDLREYDQKEDARKRFNYKMTDLQAAMGISQLERLDEFISKRRAIAAVYDQHLASLPVGPPPRYEGHVYYRYVLTIKNDSGPAIETLNGLGVGADRPVYRPIHRYLDEEGYPRTDDIWGRSLSLPIYPSLSEDEAAHVVTSVLKAFQGESNEDAT